MKIVTDMPLAEYHASDRLSTSKLKTFADLGPMAYKARHLTAENKQQPTAAMLLGQAFEDLVQLPADAFRAKWVEAPSIEGKADEALLSEALAIGCTNDGAPWTKRHDAKTVHLAMLRARGVNALSRGDGVTIERMAESVARNADAQAVIKGAATQVSLIDDWALEILPGIQARPDWYHEGGSTVDLKSTSDFTGYDRAILNLHAHSQAAIIDQIAGRAERVIIVCENEWPFRCQVIDLSRDWLDAGQVWVDTQIAGLRVCYERDEWPLCAPRRVSNPPAWLVRKTDADW